MVDNLFPDRDRGGFDEDRSGLPVPEPLDIPLGGADPASIKKRVSTLELFKPDLTPSLLPNASGNSLVRPGKVTKVTEGSEIEGAEGPPYTYRYQGVYSDGVTELIDGEQQPEVWKTATLDTQSGDRPIVEWETAELVVLGDEDSNDVYSTLAVDDYVLVLHTLENLEERNNHPAINVKQPQGIVTNQPVEVAVTDAHDMTPVPKNQAGSPTQVADVGSWVRTAQPAGKDGVDVPVTTRVVYREDSHEILYGFYRIMTFDAFGRLAALSAESRYIISSPADC